MTEIISPVVADLKEQFRVAGEDSTRREAVIVEGLVRLPAPRRPEPYRACGAMMWTASPSSKMS